MITFDSSNLPLYRQDLAAAAPVKPGHLQSAVVRLCYSNVSHLTHALQSEGISTCWLGRGCWMERLCDLPNRQCWFVSGIWSEFHQVVLLEELMTEHFCLSHGNRVKHMKVIKATCGCGVVAAKLVFQSAWWSVLGHTLDQLQVQNILVTRTELYRLPLSSQCLKCRAPCCSSLSSSAWWMTGRDSKIIFPKQTCWFNWFELRCGAHQTTVDTNSSVLSSASLFIDLNFSLLLSIMMSKVSRCTWFINVSQSWVILAKGSEVSVHDLYRRLSR